MKFPTFLIAPPGPHALGATLGQDCMAKLDAELSAAKDQDCGLLLDLSAVKAVNGSFLKATVFWALQCGQAEVQQAMPTSKDRWAVRPLRIFPAVSGCSGEVADDVIEFFNGRGLPMLHVDKRKPDEFVRARILGNLDPILDRTLAALAKHGEGTAATLAAQSNEKITLNGWNNRLADLHLLRLARRRREGKFWIYSPTAKAISLWD